MSTTLLTRPMKSGIAGAAAIALAVTGIALVPAPAGADTAATVVVWGSAPNAPAGLTGVVAIDGGEGFALALRDDGTVITWGQDFHGETQVPDGLSGVTAIAAGAAHALALKGDGTVVGWGDNARGNQATPPPELHGVRKIAAGGSTSVALLDDATVVAWGGFSATPSTPTTNWFDPQLRDVVDIAAGSNFAVAVLSDGSVAQFGPNATTTSALPPQGPAGIVSVATSGTRDGVVALKGDGTVITWGGLASPPAGLSGVTAVAASLNYATALKGDGTVVTWGLFTGSEPPAGLKDVTAIGGSAFGFFAIVGPATAPVGPVDATPPAASPTASPARNAAGWSNAPVTVTWNWSDAGSGIDPALCPPATLINSGVNQTVASTCTDLAGNVSAARSVPVSIDTAAPTTSPTVSPERSSTGWYTGALPTVTWNWWDPVSGVDPANCPATTVAQDADGVQSIPGHCADLAGNVNNGSSVLVQIDRAGPNLSPALSPASLAAGYAIGAVVAAAPNATDAASGVASSSCGAVDTSTAGTRTLSCAATDIAGNTGTSTISYTVAVTVVAPALPYAATVVLPGGTTYKAGAAVPIQFKLTGTNGQKLTVLQGLAITLNCGAQVTVGSLPPVCAIYNPLTGNFVTAVAIPKATAPGALPVKIAVTDRGAALAAGSTSIAVK